MRAFSAVLLAALAVPVFGGYNYYLTDSMQSLRTDYWTSSGSPQFTNYGGYWGGYGGSGSSASSLVSTVAVPDSTHSYAAKATLHFPSGGYGNMSLLLRASSTFSTGGMPTSAYVVNFVCGASSSTMAVTKIVNGSYTTLSSGGGISCSDGMTVKSVITDDGQIATYVNEVSVGWSRDTSLTTGAAGVVLPGNGSSSLVISQVQLGPADRIAPGPITGLTYSVYGSHVDFQWTAVPDDANGSGVSLYQFLRDDQFADNTTGYSFSDTTVQPGTEYVYEFLAYDEFFNSVTKTITIQIPQTPGSPPVPPDGRRVGVRSTGAYWGASTEQIDVLSGNVNYTVPLVKAMGRVGMSAGFSLNYNSQNWRLDSGGTWNLAEDVGYGYGWKLLIGSVTPIWANQYTIAYYSFVDSTGAEYKLDRQNGSVWTSAESVYVSYDSNGGRLHFRDGSFWIMECTSATNEPDSGTKYPTVIEDTNGNKITITYMAGAGWGGNNSSARITQIQDVRGTYTFTYNGDSPNHLTGIANNMSTSESYAFGYGSVNLQPPFSSTSYGTVALLNYVNFNTTSQRHTFGYSTDNSGTLASATLPNGGNLLWSYQNAAYGNGATYRALSQRQISADSTNYDPYTFTYGTPGTNTHASTTIDDSHGNGEKYWAFSQSGANTAMVTQYQGRQLPSHTALTQNDFTWTQDTAGNLFIGSTVTSLDPGTSNQVQKKTDQQVDTYGNVVKVQQYDYNSLSNPSRIYTYSYLNSSAYTSRYIYNRLTSATVATGPYNITTLASNIYDGGTLSTIPTNTPSWDNSYASVTTRGLVTSASSVNSYTTMAYDQAGNVTTQTVNGVVMQATTTSNTNYTAPDQLSVGGMSTSLTYNSFLGVTSATGPNGDTSSTAYSTSTGLAISSSSPFGSTTYYTYSTGPDGPGNPTTVVGQVNGRSTTTTLDGLGRPIKVITKDSGGVIKSQVDTRYAACACSPTGKMTQQSMPHTPDQTAVWTTYTYDGLGRTLSVVAPDGASTTTYLYWGNNVKVTDAAGKWKIFLTDAFGNLTNVVEPDPANPTTATYTTGYTYDGLNNVVQVLMPRPSGTQTRTFVYSGKLLTSATNPENGTVSYTYNSYLKVATKTDAKGQAVKYSYDSLARLQQVQRYPAGLSGSEDTCQQENYYYDSSYNSSYSPNYVVGRLAKVQYKGGFSCGTTFTETYGYNRAGQKTNKGLQVTRTFTALDNNSNPITGPATADLESTYAYDTEGRMTSVQYPGSTTFGTQAGPNYGYAYDTMGRLNTMTNLATSSQIITGMTYDAGNRMLTMSGSVAETRSYNTLGQLTQLGGLTYSYSSTQNNGKITSQNNTYSGEQVVYAYDALNRLASAAATNNSWGQSYNYDGFGNLTDQNVTAGTAPALHVFYSAATNRISTDCADANGNINASSVCGSSGYGYDIENRIVSVPTALYNYAPGNKRVWRGAMSGSTITLDEITFWSVSGQKLATYNLTQTAVNGATVLAQNLAVANSYFGGRLISNGSGYVNPDRLGSVGSFYPWGQEKPSATTNGKEKFTGYFRDSETGLDYAKNRYHQPGMGRFLTPDPYIASVGAADPGSWNRYAYVGGDPINFKDPRGLMMVLPAKDPEPEDPDPPEGPGPVYIPTAPPGPGPDPQHGGGGVGNAFQTALSTATSTATSILYKTSWTADCQKDLAAVGTTVKGLQEAARIVQFLDGTTSDATVQSLYTNAANPTLAHLVDPTVTVMAAIAASPATSAMAALGGDLVYLNAAAFNQYGSGFVFGTIVHELLHNITGLTDPDIQKDLGLPETGGSINISVKLLGDCFLAGGIY